VRQRDSKEILYIGKSGTIDSDGDFKGQDISERLMNVREKESKNADDWFGDIVKEGAIITIRTSYGVVSLLNHINFQLKLFPSFEI
jgi:hypothetical protein